jgi:two-component system cell cycle response regulator
MKLRALVVESNGEDLLFLESALREIGEGIHWTQWVQVETHQASNWREAAAILKNRAIDVVLLGLNLSDSQGAETFRRTQAMAPQIPIVLIVEDPDRDLAAQLVREGAQDFLLRGQLDCGPLIHALENAMERHRLVSALRATTMIDPLTGLLNRGGFLTLAGRDRMLAERLGVRFILIAAENGNTRAHRLSAGPGQQKSTPSQDLALVEAADHLRSLAGPMGLTARIADTRFAITLFDSAAESVEAAWARVEAASLGSGSWISSQAFAAENSSGRRAAHGEYAGPERIPSSKGLPHKTLDLGFSIFDARNPVALEVLLDQAETDLRARAASGSSPKLLPTSPTAPRIPPDKVIAARH